MSTFNNGEAEARVAERYADFDWAAVAETERQARVAQEARREVERLTGSVPAAEAPKDTTPVREVSYAVRPASEAAVAFLVRLTIERTPDVDPALVEKTTRAVAEELGQRGVSAKIDELKATPRPARKVEVVDHAVPAGRYAVTGDGEEGQTVFIKVDRPTEGRWAGYTFVKVQAGDDEHRVSRATEAALLAKIERDGAKEAAIRYGLELGHCGVCGRTLTNEESREAGIGPTCASKMGW